MCCECCVCCVLCCVCIRKRTVSTRAALTKAGAGPSGNSFIQFLHEACNRPNTRSVVSDVGRWHPHHSRCQNTVPDRPSQQPVPKGGQPGPSHSKRPILESAVIVEIPRGPQVSHRTQTIRRWTQGESSGDSGTHRSRRGHATSPKLRRTHEN